VLVGKAVVGLLVLVGKLVVVGGDGVVVVVLQFRSANAITSHVGLQVSMTTKPSSETQYCKKIKQIKISLKHSSKNLMK